LLQILNHFAIQLALKTFKNKPGGLSVGWRAVSILTAPNLKHAHIMFFERKIMTSGPVSVLRLAMALCQSAPGGTAMSEDRISRRDALKKTAYMTPIIITLLAKPSFASSGSGQVPTNPERNPWDSHRHNDGHPWWYYLFPGNW
jgi:hypothetical protein